MPADVRTVSAPAPAPAPAPAAAPAPASAPRSCAKCSTPVLPGTRFCEKCGTAVPGVRPLVNTRGRVAQSRLASSAHLGQIKSARITIGVVALITLVFTIFLHTQSAGEIAKARLNPAMVVDEQLVAQQNMLFVANYLLAATYFGLLFWVGRNPFAACLTALIIYISLNILNAAISPLTIFQGILIKAVVVALLLNGMKSGLAYRRLKAKGAIA